MDGVGEKMKLYHLLVSPPIITDQVHIATIQGTGNPQHVLKAPKIEKHATPFIMAPFMSPAFMGETGLSIVSQNVGLS